MASRFQLYSALAVLTAGTLYPVHRVQSAMTQVQATTGLTQYTFGTPSGEETEILADINRARANPAVEGRRLVNELNALYPGGTSGINLTQLLSQFQSYPARPPLAFNADLNAAAQFHLPEMIAMGGYTHNSPNGETPVQRVASFGYSLFSAENVTGSANYPVSVLPSETEDNYEIDANEPGYVHRLDTLEPSTVSEVEIGIAQKAVGGWNVEDIGSANTPTLLTGTVFTDNAATGLYVSGEGVASVVVTAPGASSFYAVTVESGAYTLPLDLLTYNAGATNPTVQVVFTDALGNVTTQTVALTHTVAPNGTMTYTNAQGQVRYDNAEADLVEPATAGGSGGGGDPMPTPTPTPTPVAVMPQIMIEPGTISNQFVLTRTGDASEPLSVSYEVKGSAVAGQDYSPLKGVKNFKAGKSVVKINVQMLPGAQGTVKLKIMDGTTYSASAPNNVSKIRLTAG